MSGDRRWTRWAGEGGRLIVDLKPANPIAELASAEVLKHVSPVAWQHINFYGRYL